MRKIKVALGLSGGVDPDNTLTGSRGLRPRARPPGLRPYEVGQVARARLRGKLRVALGLSGGVDSAVSAYLLKKQGYDVSCMYLNCYDGDTPGCRGDNDRKDALAVAMHLGLPFRVLDFRKEYQAAVIGYFKKEYLAGRTPNPDVVCNRDIKFGLFMDWSIKHRYDYIATGHYAKLVATPAVNSPLPWSTSTRRGVVTAGQAGHYARVSDTNPRIHANDTKGRNSRHSNGKFASFASLFRPADEHKDQTYFLWAVPAEKFRRVLFPLGNLLKTEVREIALKIGLPVAHKKDSTGICFVGEVRVEDFLKRLGVKEKIGEVVIRTPLSFPRRRESIQIIDIDSGSKPGMTKHAYEVVGRHRGVWFYTIGQRHGFKITNLPPCHPERSEAESRDLAAGDKNIAPLDSSTSSLRSVARNDGVTDRPPLYVIGKDIKKNRLVVGFGADCYRDNFEVSECNWLVSKKARPSVGRPGLNKFACLVRIRHGGDLIPCSINASTPASPRGEHQRINVSLSEAQRGIAAGQSAVFYDETGRVLGGGIIL